MSPELPDPSFAKIVVRTDNPDEREALKHRLRKAIAEGLASEAQVRVSQWCSAPTRPTRWPTGLAARIRNACARSPARCAK